MTPPPKHILPDFTSDMGRSLSNSGTQPLWDARKLTRYGMPWHRGTGKSRQVQHLTHTAAAGNGATVPGLRAANVAVETKARVRLTQRKTQHRGHQVYPPYREANLDCEQLLLDLSEGGLPEQIRMDRTDPPLISRSPDALPKGDTCRPFHSIALSILQSYGGLSV